MLTAILTLARAWKPLTLALLLAAGVAYRVVLIHQRDAARVEAAKLTSQNAGLRASIRALNSAIAAQNAALAGLKAKADSVAALARQRERTAAQAGAGALDAAARSAAAIERAPVDSQCAGAIRWGNAQAAGLAGW